MRHSRPQHDGPSWIATALGLGWIACLAVGLAEIGLAADQVYTRKDSGVKPVQGKITKMTAVEVSVEDKNGAVANVPVSAIDRIQFDEEPNNLKAIRTGIKDGNYEPHLKNLEGLEAGGSGFVKQEIDYLKLYCKAKLALSGKGSTVGAAGKELTTFLDANSGFYRYFEGVELMGDLSMAIKQYDFAALQYDKLVNSTSEEMRLRGGVTKARALRLAGKNKEALDAYRKVLSVVGSSKDAKGVEKYKLAAELGEAEGMADNKELDKAVAKVMDVIRSSNAENVELQARAYLTLGNCYLQNAEYKKAVLAFLHVHLLYFSDRTAHQESLEKLEKCYQELKDTDNALRIRQTLNNLYPTRTEGK